MANNMTDYLEIKLLDHTLGVGAFTMPTAYIALFTADPGETGDLTNEVPAAAAYARVEISTKFSAATNETSANTTEISFPQATGAWGIVTHIGIMDGTTQGAGNMLYHGQLTASKDVGNGDTFKIAVGDLSITLA